ncbi:MAG: glycosyltransferase [bacterium]
MRILFITPYLPSLIRVRSFNFIKSLKKQGHSIYLVSLVPDKKEFDNLEEVEKYCEKVETFFLPKYKSIWNCVKYLISCVSLQSAYCFSGKMKKRVKELLEKEKFDLIHVEFIRAAYYLPKENTLPSVFDSVDCVTNLYKQFSDAKYSFFMRFIRYIEWFKLSRYEPREAGRFDKVLITTENEKKGLLELDKNLPVEVIANGVDFEYFKPQNAEIEPFSIVMTGKMSYIANELAFIFFAEKIWPKIRMEIPQAILYVVGNCPGPKVKKFKSSDIIITGYVPDLRLYLSKASVVVAPIVAGGGIQNKILEAMSMAKPVVTTSKACEAFPMDVSNCLLAGDTPDEFARAVINILNDANFAESLGAKARQFVEKYYNWDEKTTTLLQIYKGLQIEVTGQFPVEIR